MNAVIIEDSKLAVAELFELLTPHAQIHIVGTAANVTDAIALIDEKKPDLIFLDINMPGGDGFDVLERSSHVGQVIFTTAYDEYAIKSFEYNALDYLLKPINPKRLALALEKIQLNSAKETEKELTSNSKIFLRDDNECWLIEVNKIHLFHALGSQCQVYFDDRIVSINKGLGKLEQNLQGEDFIRINRQQIVNLNFVEKIHADEQGGLSMVLRNGKTLSVSRRAATLFKQQFSV